MRAPLPYMVCCFLFKVENIKAKKYGKSQRKLNPPTTARRVSCETCCPAVLLVLYCCTSLCCICTTVIVNRGQGLRTPTPNPHQRPISFNLRSSPPILVYPRLSSSIPLNSIPFEETRRKMAIIQGGFGPLRRQNLHLA